MPGTSRTRSPARTDDRVGVSLRVAQGREVLGRPALRSRAGKRSLLGYPADMSAMYSVDESSLGGRHPLAKGASPGAIRSALLAEDQAAFDVACDKALSDARDSLDLTLLFRMLERWRGIAVLQRDPAVFRRVARRAAEKLSGQPSPDDEPVAVTRAKASM